MRTAEYLANADRIVLIAADGSERTIENEDRSIVNVRFEYGMSRKTVHIY